MIKITFGNTKGGVVKTTLATNAKAIDKSPLELRLVSGMCTYIPDDSPQFNNSTYSTDIWAFRIFVFVVQYDLPRRPTFWM